MRIGPASGRAQQKSGKMKVVLGEPGGYQFRITAYLHKKPFIEFICTFCWKLMTLFVNMYKEQLKNHL